ncbi:MAG: hypothetical protein IPJ60_07505 [Sphingobacteriaceae bacterium]|nr:hypothetical protein [Sphingobacteriaceae bacterium]
MYVKECSNIMEMEEQILQTEVNKLRRKIGDKGKSNYEQVVETPELNELLSLPKEKEVEEIIRFEEKELLRLMMNYGNILIDVEGEDEDKVKHSIEMTIDEFIIMELCRDEIDFEDPIHKKSAEHFLFSLKEKKLNTFILDLKEQLKEQAYEDVIKTQEKIMNLEQNKKRINKLLGRIIIK